MKTKIIIATLFITIGIAIGGLGMRYYIKYLKYAVLEAALFVGHEEFGKKNYYKAIELFSMAIGIDYNRYEAHFGLAECYKRVDLNELALEQYTLALDLNKGKDKFDMINIKYTLKQIDSLRDIKDQSTCKSKQRVVTGDDLKAPVKTGMD